MKEKSAALSLVTNEPAAPEAPKTGYETPPKHFKKKVQQEAWADLVSKAKPEMLTTDNYFAFEMAATLLAKFRAGITMNATEAKEMKKQLVALGLAKSDDEGKPPQKKKNAHYFE